MPFAVGETIGPYKLTKKLGQGGMATVFKAYHAALDRYVALKVLHPALLEDKNFLARFQREARMVARLEHPNIVPIYDYAEHENRPYLVMKYIEGETLKARLSSEGITDQEVRLIVQAVGDALSYAHRRGMLHRDIKPSNVLLANDGRIYLADFGLARMTQSGETSLTADQLVGTPQYMSPEQAQGKADIDTRSDIYSLGVMLYEIMVGNVPYNADTPFAIIHDHIYTPLPLPREQNPTVPEAVERILLKALAKNPSDRYKDVASMIDAFCNALINGVSTVPASIAVDAIKQTDDDTQSHPKTPGTASPVSQPNHIVPDVEDSYPPLTSELQKKKKKRNRSRIIAAVAVIFILIIACIIYGNRVLHAVQTRSQQGTPLAFQATISQVIDNNITPIPTTDLETANLMLNAAIESWKNGDINMASAQLNRMQAAAGQDSRFYINMLQKTRKENALLLAAMAIFNLDEKSFTQLEINNEFAIHEVLYKAAKDEFAGDFFLANTGNPYFVVAPIRYDLFHKDPQIAKNNIATILSNDQLVSDFPEIELLEVELFFNLEDTQRSTELLDKLLAKPDLPKWIITEANKLNNIITQ